MSWEVKALCAVVTHVLSVSCVVFVREWYRNVDDFMAHPGACFCYLLL